MTNIDDVIRLMQSKKIEQEINEITAEIEEECKNGVPQIWKDKARDFLAKMQQMEMESEQPTNVVTAPFGQNLSSKSQVFLEPFELLAASSGVQTDWFAQRISANGKYVIVINPFVDAPDEASITITPTPEGTKEFTEYFSDYRGQTVSLSLDWNNQVMFKASVYVDTEGSRVDGEGKILRRDREASGTKLRFRIDSE